MTVLFQPILSIYCSFFIFIRLLAWIPFRSQKEQPGVKVAIKRVLSKGADEYLDDDSEFGVMPKKTKIGFFTKSVKSKGIGTTSDKSHTRLTSKSKAPAVYVDTEWGGRLAC